MKEKWMCDFCLVGDAMIKATWCQSWQTALTDYPSNVLCFVTEHEIQWKMINADDPLNSGALKELARRASGWRNEWAKRLDWTEERSRIFVLFAQFRLTVFCPEEYKRRPIWTHNIRSYTLEITALNENGLHGHGEFSPKKFLKKLL